MLVQTGRRALRGKCPLMQCGPLTHPVLPLLPLPATSRQPRASTASFSNQSVGRIICRYASGSAEAQVKRRLNSSDSIRAVKTPLDATTPKPEPINPDVANSSTLNPPPSTRPPPLTVPARDPDSSLFAYLLTLGKAYTTFYKDGLKAIFTNRRLLAEVSRTLNAPAHITGADTTVGPTRAAVLLQERTRHDISRLPVFGLLVLVFGEFTPLVVLAFPKLTPYTCRIPKQIEKLRTNAQARQAASRRNLQYVTAGDSSALDKVTPGHIVRSLGLGSSIWDKAGVDPPFANQRANQAVRRIFRDDVMIKDGGGVNALEPDEVVLACEDRAIDVRKEGVDALRARLGDWVRATTKAEGEDGEAIVRKLLIGPLVENK
ncbi:hypothetical protein BJ170DRAFT_89735 [Xylariales sp. AK1849]|nr:hypothetical protein BJ170DRAFT_89735 [Xylariales sp. AK1849]